MLPITLQIYLNTFDNWALGIGHWGLGIGDWQLGMGDEYNLLLATP
ncbi:MAG: hypothetical protein AAFS12_00310 [Cyanobacteria bacterium J06632_19]